MRFSGSGEVPCWLALSDHRCARRVVFKTRAYCDDTRDLVEGSSDDIDRHDMLP